MSEEIEILATVEVVVSRQGVQWHQSQLGQLTHARLLPDGPEFFVREGLVGGLESFMISSGERMGIKDSATPMSRQVLHLATDGDFETVAAVVHRLDGHHRPVRRNRRFTVAVAKSQLDLATRHRKAIDSAETQTTEPPPCDTTDPAQLSLFPSSS